MTAYRTGPVELRETGTGVSGDMSGSAHEHCLDGCAVQKCYCLSRVYEVCGYDREGSEHLVRSQYEWSRGPP
jgi:hypothetical protein